MNEFLHQDAEDYLAFHELDLQNSADLSGPKIIEATIPTEAVKKTRKTLGLTLELFAVLLGINLAAMIRYENISLPPYPQGHVSRKLGLLINWLADAKSSQDIKDLMSKDNGIATLSGLLQTESVSTYLSLSGLKRMGAPDNGAGQVVGNA
jgi:transcriptional regulator with XRE-family HTH domain